MTTFSSWVLAAVQDMVDTNDWLTGIFVLIVGLYAAIMSYVLGLHSALLVEKWVLHEDVLAREQSFQAAEIAAYRSGEKRRVSARQIALEEAEPDLPRLVSSVVSEDLAINGSEDAAAAIAGAVTNGEAARDEAGEARPPPPEPAPWKKRNICKTDIAAMVVFAGLTAWAAAGTVTETNHEWLRKIWLALPFGPVGCVARWFLSRYNYKLKGNLVWFPFGTFLANMLGTAAVFGLQAGITRGQPGYWGTLVLSSVQLGLCGALTTVSTFVTEIVKFAEVFPEDLHAYTYSIGSLLGGVVLGLVLYGWVIWA